MTSTPTTSPTTENKPRVGVIGLGAMGSRMAQRLLDAGYPLTVYNRSRERAEPLGQAGATVANAAGEVIAACDVVLTMLADDAAVRATLLGAESALSAAQSQRHLLLIEMSTISVGTIQEVAQAAEHAGITLLDAAVSGSTPQAQAGELSIFVGGEEQALERARPVLEVLGKSVDYVGPGGNGKLMKIVTNALLGLGIQAIAEALALGQKGGLDLSRMIEVLSGTAVVSPSQKAKFQNARQDDYSPTFALRLMAKDYSLVMNESDRLAVPMPATAAARQMALAERARSDGDQDFSVLIRLMRQLAGVAE